MKQVTAICPGSFDPVTVGHLDIITRAAAMFEQVRVVVMTNTAKSPSFSAQERMEMLRDCTRNLTNVLVDSYDGLLADYACKTGATAIVKGLRAVSDFEYEFQMALTNKKLYGGAETVFFTTRAENMYLSSSIVRDIASMGRDIGDFVPPEIHDRIVERLCRR